MARQDKETHDGENRGKIKQGKTRQVKAGAKRDQTKTKGNQRQHEGVKGEGGDATQSPPYHSRVKVTSPQSAPPPPFGLRLARPSPSHSPCGLRLRLRPPKASQDETLRPSYPNLGPKRPRSWSLFECQIGPTSAQDAS